jgi:hypothetical protein
MYIYCRPLWIFPPELFWNLFWFSKVIFILLTLPFLPYIKKLCQSNLIKDAIKNVKAESDKSGEIDPKQVIKAFKEMKLDRGEHPFWVEWRRRRGKNDLHFFHLPSNSWKFLIKSYQIASNKYLASWKKPIAISIYEMLCLQNDVMVPISPTFFEHLLCTKVKQVGQTSRFSVLKTKVKFFWGRKEISVKAALKMLVKFTNECKNKQKCKLKVPLYSPNLCVQLRTTSLQS